MNCAYHDLPAVYREEVLRHDLFPNRRLQAHELPPLVRDERVVQDEPNALFRVSRIVRRLNNAA